MPSQLQLLSSLCALLWLSGCPAQPISHLPVPNGGEGLSALDVDGGRLDRLVFAVVGDTRPSEPDDDDGYPTGVIRRIFADLEALSPHPAFVITTGDYQFVTPGSGHAAAQLAVYLQATQLFNGPLYPSMGNHECNGYTDSQCGPNGTEGITENYLGFLQQLISPLGIDRPYYRVLFQARDSSWTGKIVVIAANAWDSTQAAFLAAALSLPTTYTFVVRHEPSEDAADLASIGASDWILAGYPWTLLLVGHTHTYLHSRRNYRELIVGNGGAPLTQADGPVDYGFGLVSWLEDGDLQVQQYGYADGLPIGVPFVITPAGTPP